MSPDPSLFSAEGAWLCQTSPWSIIACSDALQLSCLNLHCDPCNKKKKALTRTYPGKSHLIVNITPVFMLLVFPERSIGMDSSIEANDRKESPTSH